MLTQICQYLRNWFELDHLSGRFMVNGGTMTFEDGSALPLLTNQYYRVIGSVFNDGVHVFGTETLTDEPSFYGAIWPMAVPPVVVELANDVQAWVKANSGVLQSPYQSESFGGYSYSLKSGDASEGAYGGLSWASQFAARLAPWRKI